jgi:hypothetical protein
VQVRILPPLPWIFREPAAGDHTVDAAGRAYSFLLGMYLGDGHIVAAKKSYRLQIYLNTRYRDRIDRVVRAITTVLPERPIAVVPHGANAVAVSTYFAAWPWLFPQHGPGHKHARRISLEGWQHEIIGWYPEEFLRGCIESDGSRHRRIVNGKNYPAYSFCNKSDDIRGLFTDVCDMLGVHWRRANAMVISIARRHDVARLDRMFGYDAPPATS